MEKLFIGETNKGRRRIIEGIVKGYEDIFEYDEEKEGRVGSVKHQIIIDERQKPIAQRRYKETGDKAKFISQEVENLLKMGKIRESWSPWASPVTLAGKKSGKYRFCID